jgi:hypothetical protein
VDGSLEGFEGEDGLRARVSHSLRMSSTGPPLPRPHRDSEAAGRLRAGPRSVVRSPTAVAAASEERGEATGGGRRGRGHGQEGEPAAD